MTVVDFGLLIVAEADVIVRVTAIGTVQRFRMVHEVRIRRLMVMEGTTNMSGWAPPASPCHLFEALVSARGLWCAPKAAAALHEA
jgi:hypothetical protein